MPQLGSPISTPAGMPGVNAAHRGKFPSPTFDDITGFANAVTPNATGYSADTWPALLKFQIATEPVQIQRYWDGTSGRNFLTPSGKTFVLNGTTNQVWPTSGAPSGGLHQANDYALDGSTGLLYHKINSGTWDAGTQVFSVASGGSGGSTVAGAPTGVAATPGNASASVAFTAPSSNGGATITGYTVTASPGGATASGTGSPITVPGLTNGTAYTFTVHATNSVGNSAESAASTAVTPAAGSSVAAHRFIRFQVNSINGGGNAALFSLNMFTADGVDRAAGVVYTNANAGDYPSGNVLTNGHTNASNWYSTALPASATFDLTTPRAIDHIGIVPIRPGSDQQNLATSISLLGSDDGTTFTEFKRWDNITISTNDWGVDNTTTARIFSVT